MPRPTGAREARKHFRLSKKFLLMEVVSGLEAICTAIKQDTFSGCPSAMFAVTYVHEGMKLLGFNYEARLMEQVRPEEALESLKKKIPTYYTDIS